MPPQIAIVVPCFNESERFNKYYFQNLVSFKDTSWIFVDDGSNDATYSKIVESLGEYNNVYVIQLSKNRGKANAVAKGMEFVSAELSNSEWVGFLDADGAFSPIDIFDFIELTRSSQLRNFESIYSSRVKLAGREIKRNHTRHLISRIITSFFSIYWKDIPYDTQSGLKLYRFYPDYKKLFSKNFETRWFFDIELHIRFCDLFMRPMSVWEQPIKSWIDQKGTKITFTEKIRIFFEIFYILKLVKKNRSKLNFTSGD
jgi:glycosyltransferase involved in cell wall biosynthesis